MKKFGWIALLVLLVACNHKQHNQAQAEAGSAPVTTESENTGQPVYPRATLVALPSITNAPPASVTTNEEVPTPDTNAAPASTSAPDTNVAPTSASASNLPAPTNAVPGTSTSNELGQDTNTVVTAAPGTNAPPITGAPATQNDQVVVLQTTFGRMVIELDDFAAPKTCDNFRSLVSSGFYNGTIFHRVIPHFIIQGGDPNTKTENRVTYGQGDPGYTLPPEIKLHHDRGAVAMARLPDAVNPQRDSNGSQFYICVEPCPTLDDQYTVFAHVIQGMDVAERIASAPRDNRDDPLERVAMDARLEPRNQALQESPTINH